MYRVIPNWLSWLVVGSLIMAGLWLVWQGLTRRSKLLKPEALDLNIDNPQHLCGREDDIQALVAAVILKPVVFLEGESGVGKSALVRAGLIPIIRQISNPKLIPIYINCYGEDWDQGLSSRLSLALHYTLTAEAQGQLTTDNLEVVVEPTDGELEDTRSLLHRVHDKLGKQRLLLIFDQFDDYLVTHHHKFLRNGRWLTAKELISQNEFWCGIYNELEHRNLHCLFVTRRRWAMALEAVRFRLPVQRALNLVTADTISDLLSKLTKSEIPVISNPSVGWTALKDLLIQDLTNKNYILPIQATLAFRSLRVLSELSIEAYEAIGRLEGMETAAIQNAVFVAAKYAGVSESQVQNALLSMVDETIPLLPKSRAVNENVVFAVAKIDENQGNRLLTSLEQSGIVRRGLGNINFGDCAWTLYHDYLARLVLVMQRHAGRWQRLLQARHRTFYAVEGLRAKWRSLLSLKELLGLLRETLFGHIVWNGYRFFGLLSILRILPFIAAILLITTGIRYGQNVQARNTADLILQSIKNAHEIDSPVAGDTLRQFWQLAAADRRLKLAFVERSLLNSSVHPVLIERLDILIQSLFGLDPNASKRNQAMHLIFSRQPDTINPNHQMLPYPVLLAAGIYLTNPDIFAHFKLTIATNIEAAIRTCRDTSSLIALGKHLRYLEKYLLNNQIQTIAERLVGAMYASNDAWQIIQLAENLIYLGAKLPPSQVKLGVERLVGIMRGTTNRNLMINIGQILSNLGAHLPTTQAEFAAKHLVTAIGASTDHDKMSSLATILINLTTIMQPMQIQTIAQLLVTVMHTSKDREQLSQLRQTLLLLAQRLPQPEIVVEKLANYLRDIQDPDQRTALSQTVLELGKFLQPVQLQTAAAKLVESMMVTKNPDQLAELGNDLGKLVTAINPSNNQPLLSHIQTGTERLVTVMADSTVPRHLAELGTALAAFNSQLPKIQAEIATTRLVEAMHVSDSLGHLITLGQALSNFNQQLPPQTAQAGAERLLEMLETGIDLDSLPSIGKVLNALGTQLPNTPEIIERLLILLSQTQEREHLISLTATLDNLCQHLTPTQAQKFIPKILDIITVTTNADTQAGLGQILSKFIYIQPDTDLKILAQSAQIGSSKLIEAMQSSTDWEHLVALGTSLANIATAKPFKSLITIKSGPERLMEAMRANAIPTQLATLGQTLYRFQQYLPATIAQAAAERLIAVMRTNTISSSLIELGKTLNAINEILSPSQIQIIGDVLIEAMQASSDEEQLLQLGKSFNSLNEKLSSTQIQAGAKKLVEVLHTTTEHVHLVAITELILDIGQRLEPNVVRATAKQLVAIMRTTSDSEQLVALSKVLINLIHASSIEARVVITPQIEACAIRLIEMLQVETSEQISLVPINLALSKLGTYLLPPQLHFIAEKLVEAMQNSSDWRRLSILSMSFVQLGTLLPATSIQAGVLQLITAMQRATRPEAFLYIAKLLETFPIVPNSSQIPSTVELLKAPLAVGETKLQLLKFISKLAGQNFNTSDIFAAWVYKNLNLDLSQPPVSPFQ